jgi:MBG domain-containing protein/YDG domain-containing protein
LNGVVGTEDVTCSGGSATFADKNVGSWLVTATGLGLSGVDAGNYTVNSSATDTADITKALLTVTADNQSIIFGQALPTFTFQYDGFVNLENASVIDTAPTCSVGAIPMFGDYPITCSGGSDNNYDFSYVNGTLTVQPWTLTGFYKPVDMTPLGGATVWNTVKGGSTVPLKFDVFAGDTELTDPAMLGLTPLAKQVLCNGGPEDTIEVLATGGTSLRYDWTSGQFIFNWQTPKLPGKCYSVTLTTQDGSTITAFFKLK